MKKSDRGGRDYNKKALKIALRAINFLKKILKNLGKGTNASVSTHQPPMTEQI